jgi:hypothetical protein
VVAREFWIRCNSFLRKGFDVFLTDPAGRHFAERIKWPASKNKLKCLRPDHVKNFKTALSCMGTFFA